MVGANETLSSMAAPIARIPDSSVLLDEYVVVPCIAELELEDSMAPVDSHGGVGGERPDVSQLGASGPSNDFLDATDRVGDALPRLREKSLVVMLVAVEYEIRIRGVEYFPERAHL